MKGNFIIRLLNQGIAVLPALTFSQSAFAEGTPLQVNPQIISRPGAPSANSVSRSGTANVQVRLINSCFGTNLRAVSNPLAPNSTIEAKLQLTTKRGPTGNPQTFNFWVKYPADLALKGGIAKEPDRPIDSSLYGGVDGMKAEVFGNIVKLTIPASKLDVELDPDGVINREPLPAISIGNPQFFQKVYSCENTGAVYGGIGYSAYTPTYPCGSYMGKDGALSFKLQGMALAADNSGVDLQISFPGQTGTCGGYFSPLMLFFTEDRPLFEGASAFKLKAEGGYTAWVKAGDPGFFLAIDRNKNGKIDDKTELFGDQDSEQNGFEALRQLDSNKDKKINAKDKSFKKLLLWQDKNGDGLTQPEELSALHKRVSEISLDYKRIETRYGSSAEARQKADFRFKDEEGKEAKGRVEDIWLAPVPGPDSAKAK